MALTLISRIADTCKHPARLCPTLLCLVPMFVIAMGFYGSGLPPHVAVITLSAAFCGLFLLTPIARARGRRLETRLFDLWGGPSAVHILRHRDTSIDLLTKRRYRKFLEQRLEITFPTRLEEESDPDAADALYRNAMQWLRGKTGNKAEFPRLFKSRVNYDFLRNCLGLRPFAVLISLCSTLWTMFMAGAMSATGISLHRLLVANAGGRIAFIVALNMTFAWTVLVNKTTVRWAAVCHAKKLLKSCDHLSKKAAASV